VPPTHGTIVLGLADDTVNGCPDEVHVTVADATIDRS
jgi:hypothetical protein